MFTAIHKRRKARRDAVARLRSPKSDGLSTLRRHRNEELQHRNAELSQLNDDLNNLFAGANIPIIILGGDGRIRRFTSTAGKVLGLIPADLGRPIGDIRLNLDLEQVCKDVIDTAIVAERRIRTDVGAHASSACRRSCSMIFHHTSGGKSRAEDEGRDHPRCSAA